MPKITADQRVSRVRKVTAPVAPKRELEPPPPPKTPPAPLDLGSCRRTRAIRRRQKTRWTMAMTVTMIESSSKALIGPVPLREPAQVAWCQRGFDRSHGAKGSQKKTTL